jgi:hypothetical protein
MRLPRRFQFRLRTLMIVVTLLAVPRVYVALNAEIVAVRTASLQSHRLPIGFAPVLSASNGRR